MKSLRRNEKGQAVEDWRAAMGLLVSWEAGEDHLDNLLDRWETGRSRWLVMEVFRNWERAERFLRERVQRRMRPRSRALLRMGLAEAWSRRDGGEAAVVHHAVEVARAAGLSRAEQGFVNAVLRRVVRSGVGGNEGDAVEAALAEHPAWLRGRWREAFGEAGLRRLVLWNQTLPEVTVRVGPGGSVEGLEPTGFGGYYRVGAGSWGERMRDNLRSGKWTIQDPFTRIPVELLGVGAMPGERILDLCAAPGGKSRQLAEKLSGRGRLWAVDRPGWRLERLRENLMPWKDSVEVVGGSVEQLEPDALPQADAVLLDVPCSNTGVIRRRPDVRLRLREERLEELVRQQGLLLEAASRWVCPGGRLVYSTCSLEAEENDGVVEAFLRRGGEWQLRQWRMSFPPDCGHDGGGAFLLTKAGRG